MTKAFESIHAGLQEALDYAKGTADKSKYRVTVPAKIDVKGLRTSMGLTQEEFAQRYLFTPARVKDWEQGRSSPDGATRAYLTVIERQRAAVDKALRAGTLPTAGELSKASKPQRGYRIRRDSDTGKFRMPSAQKKAASHKRAG